MVVTPLSECEDIAIENLMQQFMRIFVANFLLPPVARELFGNIVTGFNDTPKKRATPRNHYGGLPGGN